ncbi:hypothetical protein D1007_25629 [Hordeum vulgare]|nr:hypothetical protein D1007_25629 [Hordeum vulgare]
MRKTSQSVLLLLATALLFLPARSHAASPTSTAYDELRSRGFPRGLLRANVTLEAGSGDFAVDLVSGSRIVLPAHFCLTRKSVAVGFDRSLHHDELMASLLHALSGHVEELLRVVVYPAAKSLHHYEFMASLLHALSGHVEELLGRVVVDPAATCLVADTCLVWPVKLARKLGIAYVTEPVLIFNLYYVHLLTKNGHIGINGLPRLFRCFPDVRPHGHSAWHIIGGAVVEQESELLGLFDAFFASLSMILVSEIHDETFNIAALMTMRHAKLTVHSDALSPVLSAGLGRTVPNLISRKHTNSAATGIDLSECLFDVHDIGTGKLEAGQGKSTFRQIFSRLRTPIFLESFVLTFLAEWGDRSQIATIALANHKNAATLGHAMCTSFAVVGGSMLASRISQDGGGARFAAPATVVFAIHVTMS